MKTRNIRRYFVVVTPKEIYGLFADEVSARRYAERSKFLNWGVRRMLRINQAEAQDDGKV